MKVVKRDGRKAVFEKDKIKNAILGAFNEVDGEITQYAKDKARDIATYIEDSVTDGITVEEIQDIIENKLMASNRKDVAKSFILYRNNRTKIRERKTKMMLDVAEKLRADNVQNQNANVDEKSFGGRVGEASDTVLKQFALDNCLSEKAKNNHINNRIYTHDLASYPVGNHNCLTIPFDKLLANGFNTRQTDVRPANSVNTAFQLVAVIFQLQSLQQFGGVSASHLDWTMIPYVRKSFWKHFKDGLNYVEDQPYRWDKDFSHIVPEETSIELPSDEMDCGSDKNVKCGLLSEHMKAYRYAIDMTTKETQQAVEGLYHNLNTLQSRSGNQLPFTSINYGTCTLPEGRMVIKALISGSIKGVGKFHKTSIFPCGIFQIMDGVNKHPGEPNYDLFKLAIISTAQRLYPNYANCDWSGNAGYDKNDPRTYFSTMGKRKLSSCKTF